ncbi:hypothetical protein [Humidesulfovibrio sp.]
MTPAIGTSSTASAAHSAQTAQVDASASARPQVQTRRVSLKLGPLGISYSTDQVLWTEAVAAAAAQTLGASEAKGVSATQGPVASVTGVDVAGQDGIDGGQAQAKQAEATSRAFSLELAQAWRRQVEERVRSDKTYGRRGSIGAAAAEKGGQAAGRAGLATTTAAPSETTGAAAQAGPAAASAAGGSATGLFATQQESAPASRMRQAIGAYLACARNFSAVPPMLTAVA